MPLAKTDLNLLPLFDAILDTVSVGKAAERVGLSKPAASHALARLRAQVGDPILVRAGQRWVLTPRAAVLAPRVRAALGEARAVLTAEHAFSPRELRREFRIHVTEEALALVGLRLGHTVSSAAPHVALRFLPPVADAALALRSDADLALGQFTDLAPDLHTQKLADDRYVTVVRAGHPKVKDEISLETFVKLRHVIVAPRGEAVNVVDAALAERGLTRRAVRWVPYGEGALELVAASDCVVTLPERLARRVAKRLALQILPPPIPLPTCGASQVWHARVGGDPAHAWLRRLVAKIAHEDRG